jgi:menaquinone-9 beta-reductase
MRRTRPIIIGGGPAGAATAIRLARVGAEPMLLERNAATGDALCGGFLSWATLEQLRALGITPEMLGGTTVRTLALFDARRCVRLLLPAPAMGVSRRRLDSVLLNGAEQAGAHIQRGNAVRSIDGTTLTLASGETLSSSSLFLSTGKHELRGATRDVPDIANPSLGLRVRLPADPALQALLGECIELHLFDGGYLGLVVQEDGTTNACMAVTKKRLAHAEGKPAQLLAQLAHASPVLAQRLNFLTPNAKIDAIGHLPYGWRAQSSRVGLFRLGDQAAVIPSLAGEGIGIALASAERAVAHWQLAGPGGAIGFQRAFARAARRPVGRASIVKHAMQSPALAPMALTLARHAPQLVAWIARTTRIVDPRP